MRGFGTFAAGLLLGLLLGALGAHLTSGDAPAPPPATARKTPRAEATAGVAPETVPASVENESAPRRQRVDRLRADMPPATGDGVITGRVVTEDGIPVADAEITAYPESRGLSRGSPDDTIEDHVARFRTQLEWRAAAKRTARSGTDGTFVVDELGTAAYQISARHDRFRMRTARDGRGPHRAGAEVTLYANAIVPVTVEIDTNGVALPERVSISFRGRPRGGGTQERWTPDDPVCRVPPGDYTVSVRVDRDEPLKSDEVDVTVPASGDVPVVRLRLDVLTRLSGTVDVPEGTPWKYLWVHLASLAPGAEASPEVLVGAAHRKGARPPEWTFDVEELEPGRYAIGASADGREFRDVEVIEVVAGENTVRVVHARDEPAAALRFRCFGPDGNAVEFTSLSLIHRGNNGSGSQGARSTELGDGMHAIHLPRDLRERPGTLSLEVSTERYGTQAVEIDPSDTRVREVRFAEAGRLRVRLLPGPGTWPSGGVSIALLPRGWSHADLFQRRRDAGAVDVGGTWEAPAMKPGEYEVVVTTGRHSTARLLARQAVSLTTGDQELTVPAPHLIDLRVTLPPDLSTKNVTVNPARAPGMYYANYRVSTDADRVAAVEGLGAGHYLVSVRAGDATQHMLIELPGDRDVTFTPQTISGMRIVELVNGGALDRAGLRLGDIIERVGERDITAPNTLELATRAAREAGRVDWTVRRGASRVTIEIDPERIGAFNGCGGSWIPVAD